MKHENWIGFKEGIWQDNIDVRDFIQQNYAEYKGDDSFLAGSTERTDAVMKEVQNLLFVPEKIRQG